MRNVKNSILHSRWCVAVTIFSVHIHKIWFDFMAMNGFCEYDFCVVRVCPVRICMCVCHYVENCCRVQKVFWNLKMKSGNDQVYETGVKSELNRAGNNRRLCVCVCVNLISISLDIKLNFLLLDKTHMKIIARATLKH